MALEVALARHHDELVADFQQFYGLNLLSMDMGGAVVSAEAERAALLCAQLPVESRTVRAESPDAMPYDSQVLRLVEYECRVLLYAMGGGKGSRTPDPLPLPSQLRKTIDAEDVGAQMAYVRSVLGMDKTDDDEEVNDAL